MFDQVLPRGREALIVVVVVDPLHAARPHMGVEGVPCAIEIDFSHPMSFQVRLAPVHGAHGGHDSQEAVDGVD